MAAHQVKALQNQGHYLHLGNSGPCPWCSNPLNEVSQCYPGLVTADCLRFAQQTRQFILRFKRACGTARSLTAYIAMMASYVLLKREYAFRSRMLQNDH
jgi:hypothetical protein